MPTATRRVIFVERLLLLWDELDDLVSVCRHVAVSAADEVASLAAPIGAAASALGAGLLLLPSHAYAAIVSGVVSAWLS